MTTVAILQGDVREVLKDISPGSVQTVVTSPPYFGLRNYGVDGQIGLEDTPEEYVTEMVGVFRELWRVLRDDAVCWLNLGDSYSGGRAGPQGVTGQMANRSVAAQRCRVRSSPIPGAKPKDLLGIPWRVAFALQADGWYLRSAIVWNKPNPMPESTKDRPTSSYEMVFMLTKKERYFYDAFAVQEPFADKRNGNPGSNKRTRNADKGVANDRSDGGFAEAGGEWNSDGSSTGRNLRNVWTITPKPCKEAHFATMPIDLATTCIKASTSEAGRCPSCGAPWRRIIEKGEPDLEHQIACGASTDGSYDGEATKDYEAGGAQNASDVKRRILEGMRAKVTVGWKPTCDCPEHEPVPCVVLDPFGGAGTTAMAADALGRDSALIELNPAYIEIAKKRLGRSDVLDFFIWDLI